MNVQRFCSAVQEEKPAHDGAKPFHGSYFYCRGWIFSYGSLNMIAVFHAPFYVLSRGFTRALLVFSQEAREILEIFQSKDKAV